MDRAAAGEFGVRQRAVESAHHGAVTLDQHPAGEVPEIDPGIAQDRGHRVGLNGDRLVQRRADPDQRQARADLGRGDHFAQPLGGLLDHAAGLGPLGGERGVAAGRGVDAGGGKPGRGDPQRGRIDRDIAQLDQRRRSPAAALPQAEDVLVVHPSARMLDHVELGMLQQHPAQHDAPGQQIGQLVADLQVRHAREQHAGGIAQRDVVHAQPEDEPPVDGADLEVAVQHAIQRGADLPRNQPPAGPGPDQGGRHAEHGRNGTQQEDEQRMDQAAAHQKGCPMANWNVKRDVRAREK